MEEGDERISRVANSFYGLWFMQALLELSDSKGMQLLHQGVCAAIQLIHTSSSSLTTTAHDRASKKRVCSRSVFQKFEWNIFEFGCALPRSASYLVDSLASQRTVRTVQYVPYSTSLAS